MEKTYQEQAVAFILKAVVGLGSVYIITEKFIGQIDHLFHLDSIRTAVLIFHLIYFVSPVAVVCAYFFLKKGTMQLYNKRANLILASIASLYLIFLIAAFYMSVKSFLSVGMVLITLSATFISYCVILRNKPEFKKEMFQYLSIAFIIILFAWFYLIRNDKTATGFEHKYFSDLPSHFRAMDSVDNYLNSVHNKFLVERENKLDATLLRNYFKQTGAGDTIQYATNAELIRISSNRWGLYINLLSYKALLALLPFAAVVVGFIFLLATSHPKASTTTLLKRQGDDYEVNSPQPVYIPEKEFLKLVFVVLITVIIPVLHPLETIKSTFNKPVSFTLSAVVPPPPPAVNPVCCKETPIDTTTKTSKASPLYSTKLELEGYGEVIVLSPVAVDMRKFTAAPTEFDVLKTGLKNVNSNLIFFSQRIGPERDAQTTKGPVFYYPSTLRPQPDVFKKIN